MALHPYTRLFSVSTDPTVGDDSTLGYEIGDHWVTPSKVWVCRSPAVGAAVWQDLASGGGGGFTQEEIEDFVGAMFSGNTETGIAVTYDDTNGKIDLVAEVTQAELDAIPQAPNLTRYNFDSSTTASDPGTGDLRFNSATPASITQLYISQVSGLGGDITRILEASGYGDVWYLQDVDDAAKWIRFTQNAAGTDNGDWWTIPVTYVGHASSLFTNGTELAVTLNMSPNPSTILDVEGLQDLVGGMITGNVETGISVTYDDTAGKLDFDAQTAGDVRYAPIAKGVTNGDTHDHVGGDGGSIAFSSLSGSFNDGEGDPADTATTAADGTSAYAARRDHAHRDYVPMRLRGVASATWTTSPQNDFAPSPAGSDEIDISANTANIEFTGMDTASYISGQLVIIRNLANLSTTNVVLKHADTRSNANYRFNLSGQRDLVLHPGDAVIMEKVSGGSWHAISVVTADREELHADRTYYVRTDGSDSNNGLANTSGGAFLTIQKALDTVSGLDFSSYNVTIQIADGTYTATNRIKSWIGTGGLTIQGNSGTPANVLISVTGNHCFLFTATLTGTVTIKDMKLQTTTSGIGIYHQGIGAINFSNIDFGACATYHMAAEGGGARLGCTGNYSITGGSVVHILVNVGGIIYYSNFTVTLTGTPAITYFAYATRLGCIQSGSMTFSGSATGTRYQADTNSVILTNGGGANYFPGNAAGSTSTGGQYQ